MHRALSLSLAAVAALLVAAAPASAKTMRMFVQFTHVDAVDVGPAGDSPGDMVITTFRVHDRTRTGRRIGAGHAVCVRTEVGRASTCTANSSLPGGRMVFAWEEHDGEIAIRAAIIGGTGAYKSARGDIRFTAVGPSGAGVG
jgi:hypothetical protein